MHEMHGFVLNWRPSPADPRDMSLRNMRVMRGAAPLSAMPPTYSRRAYQSPVRNQGRVGECTGQSVVGCAEHLSMQTSGGVLSFPKSVKFAYYNGRRMMFPPRTGVDSGCYIRTVIKAAARYGLARQSLWPESSSFRAKPTVSSYADATRFQLLEYANVGAENPTATVDNIRRALYAGLDVCGGFDVYSSFDSVGADGFAPIPKKGEIIEGGHAVLFVGYDDLRSVFEIKNSWGDDWGDAGYFYLPYWFILNNHASDFWTISAQENGEETPGIIRGVWPWLYTHREKIAA